MSLKQASIGKNLLDIVSQSKKGLIDLSRNANDLVTVIKSIDNIDDIGKVLNLSGVSKDFVASTLKANGMKDSVDDVIKAMDRFADSQKGISGVGLGFKGLGLILESMAPTLLGIAAIGGTIFALYKYFNAYNDAVKQAGESQSAYVQTAQEVQSLNSELETTQERIAELQALQSAGTITIAEENELNNLKLQNEELERQIKLKQQLSDEQSEQAVKDAMAALAYEGTYDSTQKEDYLIDETGQQIAVSKKTDLLTAAQNEVNKLAKLKDQRRKLLENNGSDEELKAVDAEITVLENKLTTEISDVNELRKNFIDQTTNTMKEGLSAEEIQAYQIMTAILDDYNNIDLTPAERQLKKLESFFSGSNGRNFIKDNLMEASDSTENLEKALRSMGLSLEDIGVDNIEILQRYLNETKTSAEGAADAIKSLTDTETIDAVTSALESQDSGYNYEQAVDSAEKIKELIDQGLVGKDEVKAFSDYLSYGMNDSYDAYVNGIDKFNRYFTTDNASGVRNFIDDLVAKSDELGKSWAKVDGDGWKFDIDNTAQAAKDMGISVAMIEDIFGRLQDYGFDIEWTSALDGLEEYKASLNGIKDIYDNMSDGAGKDRLGDLISEWDNSLAGFEEDLSTLTEDQLIHIQFVYDLESLQSQINEAYLNIESGEEKRENYATILAGNTKYISQAKDGLNLDEVQLPVRFSDVENEIAVLKNKLVNETDEDVIVQIQTEIANKQEIEKAILNDFSDQHPEITPETDTSEVQKALDDYFSKPQHLVVDAELDQDTVKSELDNMSAGSTITFDADINGVIRKVEAVKNEDGTITYTTEINGEPTSIQLNKDGTITYVVNEVEGTKVEIQQGPIERTVNEVPGTQIENVEDAFGLANFIVGESPDEVPDATGKANYFLGSYPINIPPAYQTIYRDYVDTKSTKATGTMLSPAHAWGTGYNAFNLISGSAYVNGRVSLPQDEDALVNEMGHESLIRDGKWLLIPGGMHIEALKKGDIVLTASQTESLLKHGKAAGTGKAYVNGTLPPSVSALSNAYDIGSMSGSGGSFKGGASSYNPSGGGPSSSSTSNYTPVNVTPTSPVDNKEAEESVEKLDHIATKLERIEQDIKNIGIVAESAFEIYTTRNNALKNQISAVNTEILIQQQAYERYMQQAESVGLDESYASKVRDGLIDIETITDETLSKNIGKYQEWYNKAIDCRDAINELKETSRELYQQEFNNISEEYDNILKMIEYRANMLDGYINQTEAKGYIISQKYYTELIANEENTLSHLNEQRKELMSSLNNALVNGNIKKDSQAWYDMQQEINSVNEAIQESNSNIIEFSNSIRELDWSIFDKIQESISIITNESDFLVDLMSSKKLFDDKGIITGRGKATMGLYGVNFNTYMSQADEYYKAMSKVNAQLANDPHNQTLIERKRELLELQQESIIAAEDEKEAIRDLVKNGIDKQLESLQDLIDKYTDALDNQKDMFDYQKEIAEKQKEISELEKQYAAYKNDDSEEGALNKQNVENQLNELKIDLNETQYERSIADQKKLLDELYSDYETVLNLRLDDIDVLINDVIANINSEAFDIRETLSLEADGVGYQLTESMSTIWTNADSALSDGTNKITGVITTYGDNFTSSLTNVQTAINELKNVVQQAVKSSDDTANESIENVNQQQQEQQSTPVYEPIVESSQQNTVQNNGGDGVPRVGDIVTLKSGQQYYSSSWGSTPIGSMYSGVPGGVIIDSYSNKKYGGNIGNTGEYDVHIQSADGKYTDLGWVKLDQLEGYASGAKKINKDKLAWTQEHGKGELIMRQSDHAILTYLNQGDTVFSNEQSENLFDWSKIKPDIVMDKFVMSHSQLPDVTRNINAPSVNNNITIAIDKVQDYNDFVQQLQKDNRFENYVQEVTLGRAMGHNSLRKNQIKF